MLLIHCPYCGEKREEEEFTYSDEAFITRPLEPENLTDAEWADYVFMRDNLSGTKYENWVHTAGCRKFFIIKRDNLTNAIENTLRLDATKTEQAEQAEKAAPTPDKNTPDNIADKATHTIGPNRQETK